MYSAAPVVVPVATAPRRRGLAAGPLLAICCLIFVLFLIAATIVLALIPVYLPSKTVSATSTGSEPYYFTMTPDQPLTGPDGDLDQKARTDLGQQIDKAQGFPAGSTNVERISVRTPATRRKRRTFALQRNRRQTSIRILLVAARFAPGLCGVCRVRVTVFTFPFSFVFNGVLVSVTMTAVGSSAPPTVSTLPPVTGEVTTTVAGGETTTTTTAAGQTTTTTTTAAGQTTTTTTAAGETTTTAAGETTTTAAGETTTTAAGETTTTTAGETTTTTEGETTTTTEGATANLI